MPWIDRFQYVSGVGPVEGRATPVVHWGPRSSKEKTNGPSASVPRRKRKARVENAQWFYDTSSDQRGLRAVLKRSARKGVNIRRETDVKRAPRRTQSAAPVLIPKVGSLGTRFDVLSLDTSDVCVQHMRLGGKARSCVSLLERDTGIKRISDPPDEVLCGDFRRAVRRCFPRGVPTLAELSFKTAQKVVQSFCDDCSNDHESWLNEWKKERFQKVDVSPADVSVFKKAFTANVPRGWNCSKGPYIPNGHASLGAKRKDGGNWNVSDFANHCRPEVVVSSGKPRIVTLYSEYNTRVLTPLHHSLYEKLERWGWLLVGSPTNERVGHLNGGGDLLSFDYEAATDKIRSAYVNAAIDELVDKAVGLSSEEERCLRVLGELRFSPDSEVASVGQPMGSLMSFPLLCLINKAVVDMALNELLLAKKITFKEWTCHRCLINGDDLLLREVRPASSDLYEAICKASRKLGMVVNIEKSMRSELQGEINSTLFENSQKQKKTNVAALYMRPEVNDVLGFAYESTVLESTFKRVVRANAHILAKQQNKGLRALPWRLQRICRKDAKIRRAITSAPVDRREPATNFFAVVDRPSGYFLPRDEEIALIHDRVADVRERAIDAAGRRSKFRTGIRRDAHSFRSARREKPTRDEELILEVLARGWEAKQKDRMAEEEHVAWLLDQPVFIPGWYGGQSLASSLVDWIKGQRKYGKECPQVALESDFIGFDESCESEDGGRSLFAM